MHISAQTDTAIQLPQAQKPPRGNRHARRASAARPARATAQEASKQLHKAVRAHMQAALAWSQNGRQGEPPILAVKGSAGLGKTVALLKELSRPEWAALKVLYLVPALDLAEELADKAREIGINARVIRGRSQPQPGETKDGARMCAKFEIAEGLSALSIDVTNTLCRSKSPGGRTEECPFAATCPYLTQLRDKRPGLLIAAHQYLPLTVEGLKQENIDLVVIDETFWQSLVRRSHVDLARFMVGRAPGGNGYGPKPGESRVQLQDRRNEAANDFDHILQKFQSALAANVIQQSSSVPITIKTPVTFCQCYDGTNVSCSGTCTAQLGPMRNYVKLEATFAYAPMIGAMVGLLPPSPLDATLIVRTQ